MKPEPRMLLPQPAARALAICVVAIGPACAAYAAIAGGADPMYYVAMAALTVFGLFVARDIRRKRKTV